MAARILVVDDEPELARFLANVLQRDGFDVESAFDARQGLRKAYSFQPDLILLDVMMPGMDGWEMLRRLREFSDVPVIMLTAIHGTDSVVHGLDTGADDYVTKPFQIHELKARIRATLRRASLPPGEDTTLSFDNGQLVIDPGSHLVTVGGQVADLTPTEYKLLLYLAYNAGQVVSYEQILNNVWGPGYESSQTNVKVFIRNLRRKIEPDPAHPRYLLTHRGVGYSLVKT